jgi:UDP:flavonoid glycosyltransferase YjiC (YdhE family)
MARYLAYTSPARGHLYPVVATLLELRRRGHDVHVRTLASEVPILERLGLAAAPIASAIEDLAHDDWRARSPDDALARGLRIFAARAVQEVPDFRRAIEEVGPDALLVDITTVGAAAVAESTRIPWAQWIPFFRHISPFGLTAAGIEVLNDPRRALGLAPLVDVGDEWRRAALYLYFTALPFAADAEPPPSFLLVGPGAWEPPIEVPDWVDELKDPVVLVGASSEFQRDDALIETALQALRAEDVRVVVTAAAHEPARFQPPPNARVARWLPHTAVVRKAAVVVCHGGMGLTQKALVAGVPVCIVPFGRDQFEVAERVVRIGAGTRVLPADLSARSLRAAIREAIEMRAGAERVAAGFARAGGAPAAAGALESLLAIGSPGTRPVDTVRSPAILSGGTR